MLKIFEVYSNIVFIGTQKKQKNENVTNKCKWTIFFNTCCTSFFLKYGLTDQG